MLIHKLFVDLNYSCAWPTLSSSDEALMVLLIEPVVCSKTQDSAHVEVCLSNRPISDRSTSTNDPQPVLCSLELL